MRSISFTIVSVSIAVCGLDAACGETLVERGAYLVKAVAACATCHTPRTPPGPALSGGNTFKVGSATILSPNITPDRDTGIGAWSDAQIVEAIRDDVRPDGAHIGPPMPQHAFATISDADIEAIVAYLRTVPPVHHAVAVSAAMAQPHAREAARSVPNPSLAAAAERGRYLVQGPAHCVECHAVGADSVGATPRVFKGPWGVVTAPNLSPEVMRTYAPEAFRQVLASGRRADGSPLVGPMPVASYRNLRPDDVADIAAYLGAPAAR